MWISVEDKLPEPSIEVLCCLDTHEMVVLYFDDTDGCFTDNFSGEPCEDITHWQPLPEPPKEY